MFVVELAPIRRFIDDWWGHKKHDKRCRGGKWDISSSIYYTYETNFIRVHLYIEEKARLFVCVYFITSVAFSTTWRSHTQWIKHNGHFIDHLPHPFIRPQRMPASCTDMRIKPKKKPLHRYDLEKLGPLNKNAVWTCPIFYVCVYLQLFMLTPMRV